MLRLLYEFFKVFSGGGMVGKDVIFKLLMDKNEAFFNPDESKIVTFLNNYSYLKARKHGCVYEQFDSVYCDGILLNLAVRALGKKSKRKSFDMTSLAPIVFRECEKRNFRVFFIGGEEGIAEKAVEKFRQSFPRLNIVGLRHGYFNRGNEREKVLDEMVHINPDLVIVSMGALRQEEFLVDLRKRGWVGRGFTCGGFFHQTAKAGINYYPKWIDKLNLRWLYRMFDEPKLIKRYFFYYPVSLFYIFIDMYCFSKKNEK
ncbi:WecB/TagA/CpsF family glycosyltransferase [Halomonas sp. EF61]|uniref:WecB/TagA/CpsF family glycosyltransferase n=1 Tax=Halomonas sp. EF61 TaxID=2950869 RepID=UPI0032DF3CCE